MTVRWTDRAERELLSILDYVRERSPGGAAKVDARIHEAAAQLAAHPKLGRLGRRKGTRELVVAGLPYIIVYRVIGRDAYLLRLIHGARDWR